MHVIADGQILARRQRQDAQPRVFGGGPQGGEEMVHGLKNISISLCMQEGSQGVEIVAAKQRSKAVLPIHFKLQRPCATLIFELRVFGPACRGLRGWTQGWR